MTLGERLDNSIADGLVALGVGLRRTWRAGAEIADLLLSLQRAKCVDDPAYRMADALAEAEAEVDCYEPDPLWSAARVRESFAAEMFPQHKTSTSTARVATGGEARGPGDTGHPAEAAATPRSSAPEPSEAGRADSPGVVSPPDATPGHLPESRCDRALYPGGALHCELPLDHPGWHKSKRTRFSDKNSVPYVVAPEQPAGAGDRPPGIGEAEPLLPRSEHPMYARIQDCADAAVVAVVILQHTPSGAEGNVQCWCNEQFDTFSEHANHVAPLIIAELQK